MRTRAFYGGHEYQFVTNPEDPSGAGCLREIVQNDEYRLSQFHGLSGVIVDVGANCGVATAILAKQNPEARVYAFEPHPATFGLLLENARLNQVKNVVPLNMAVGGSLRWRATLCLHPDFSGGNTACSSLKEFEQYHRKSTIAIEVPCIPFDTFVETHGVDRIDVLKIDCEGGEYEILLESRSIRSGLVQNLVGEFHDLSYNTQVRTTSAELLAVVDACVPGVKRVSVLRL